MARPLKEGFDYFPLDVDFFHNKKIRALIKNHGCEGVCVYLYLLCVIYKFKGYFAEYDTDLIDDVAWGLRLTDEKTVESIEFMKEKGLFDSDSEVREKVLTSFAIQEQFQEMAKTRGKTKVVYVLKKIWLLVKEKTESFIRVTPCDDFSGKNDDFSGKNKSKIDKNTQSKVKESKGNINKSRGEEQSSAPLTQEEFNTLSSNFGADKVNEYIKRFNDYCEETGKTYAKPALTIRRWILEDEKKADKPKKSNKFCNYTDTNKVDYKAYEKQILKDMLEE